jgi:hypothetical protein
MGGEYIFRIAPVGAGPNLDNPHARLQGFRRDQHHHQAGSFPATLSSHLAFPVPTLGARVLLAGRGLSGHLVSPSDVANIANSMRHVKETFSFLAKYYCEVVPMALGFIPPIGIRPFEEIDARQGGFSHWLRAGGVDRRPRPIGQVHGPLTERKFPSILVWLFSRQCAALLVRPFPNMCRYRTNTRPRRRRAG